MAWFEDNKVLYDDEVSLLESRGLSFEIDEVEKTKGLLVIYVDFQIDEQSYKLKCEYPPSYPYFAFKVSCEEFPSGRHICPTDHNFCLFAEEQSAWRPSDNLANVLLERIPLIYKSHTNPDTHLEHDVIEGYQLSGQLQYELHSVILTDYIELGSSDTHGNILFSVSNYSIKNKMYIKGCVDKIKINDASINIKPKNLTFHSLTSIQGRWVKINSPPKDVSPRGWLEETRKVSTDFLTPKYQRIPKTSVEIDILAIAFPEEKGYRESVYNWIFIIRRRLKNPIANRYKSLEPQLVRSDYFNRSNFTARIPRLQQIQNKTVLIAGTGALGSEIALQLAKTGIGKLIVIDPDDLQVGNLPRWLSSFQLVGSPKVSAIESLIKSNYHLTEVSCYYMRIGNPEPVVINGKELNQHDFIVELIESVDQVIDCTTESNVSHYLSDLCNEHSTSYLWSTATTGGWGGIVGISDSKSAENVWFKFSKLYESGEINPPPEEISDDVQPVGCFSPTFTGTSFDLGHVSLMATRMSISNLLNKEENGYPCLDFNLAVLRLWDDDTKEPIACTWENYTL